MLRLAFAWVFLDQALRCWVGEELDQAGWAAMVSALPVRQGFLALGFPALAFVEEDGLGTH